MLRLDQVSRTFPAARGQPATRAVVDLDLEVGRGETVCLVGPSGCGKTTTLRLCNRLEEPTSGRVLVDGADAATLDPIALRRGMGYVVQRGGLFPHLTAAANVGLLCALEGWTPAATEERARELLELVGLTPDLHAGRYPSELSGGQRQRVGLARALALDPPVLLLDEPFGALDPITRDELQGELRALAERVGKTLLLVTHDLAEAFRLGDRVGLMEAGRLVQLGDLEAFRSAPANDFVRRFVEGHVVAG